MPGALYVVATPIGNLDDLSRRAEAVLRSAARILAEDTRRTRGLLSHLGVSGKPLDRLDAHASPGALRAAVAQLEAGLDIALVTDAGTPCVSDPGAALIRAAREAGVRVVPIPGASAVLSALSGSGLLAGSSFWFLGFLPRSGPSREDALDRVARTPDPVVLFESPQRLRETLGELARLMPTRSASVARELTKLHEEFVGGSLEELAGLEREWLGEITLVLGEAEGAGEEAGATGEEIDAWIDAEIEKGRGAREIAQIVSARAGLPRREIYARVLGRRAPRPGQGEA